MRCFWDLYILESRVKSQMSGWEATLVFDPSRPLSHQLCLWISCHLSLFIYFICANIYTSQYSLVTSHLFCRWENETHCHGISYDHLKMHYNMKPTETPRMTGLTRKNYLYLFYIMLILFSGYEPFATLPFILRASVRVNPIICRLPEDVWVRWSWIFRMTDPVHRVGSARVNQPFRITGN